MSPGPGTVQALENARSFAGQGTCYVPGMIPPKTILVSTDFSELSKYAVTYAADLAATLGATLVLVHVYQMPPMLMPGPYGISAELAERIPREATELLEAAAKDAAHAKVHVRTVLREGDPRDQIVAVAEAEKADLLVMGTHGRRGLSRALIGSVAEAALRTAPCPVLTVHPH